VATVSPQSAQLRAEDGAQASEMIRQRAEALSRSTLDGWQLSIACCGRVRFRSRLGGAARVSLSTAGPCSRSGLSPRAELSYTHHTKRM
jgi:hypothetical protein